MSNGEISKPLNEDCAGFLNSEDEDEGLSSPDLPPEIVAQFEAEMERDYGGRPSKASLATSLVKDCKTAIEQITSLKFSLVKVQQEKAQWEAEQEIVIATLENLRNEHQRKGFISDKKYEPGSEWPALQKKVEELKVELQKHELQLQLNLHILRLLAKGIVIHD